MKAISVGVLLSVLEICVRDLSNRTMHLQERREGLPQPQLNKLTVTLLDVPVVCEVYFPFFSSAGEHATEGSLIVVASQSHGCFAKPVF